MRASGPTPVVVKVRRPEGIDGRKDALLTTYVKPPRRPSDCRGPSSCSRTATCTNVST